MGGPFRLLSHTGVEAMRFIARSFKQLGPRTEGDPKAAYLKPRGLLYSSRFVRDLCTAPVLNAFLSEIAATPLALHGMPTAAAAVIYAPPEIEKTNQGWHLDTVGFACVIALNDPHELEGGSFQFFKGTRQSVAEWLGVETQDLRKSVGHLTSLPTEQVVTARFPAAGYAMLMQGQMVLHRGEPLRSPGERMMLVSSFMSLDPRFPDATHWPENPTLELPSARGRVPPTHRVEEAESHLSISVRNGHLDIQEALAPDPVKWLGSSRPITSTRHEAAPDRRCPCRVAAREFAAGCENLHGQCERAGDVGCRGKQPFRV